MLERMTDAIDLHGKALQLRARRQEVLSSNIANADTPGYKARDFDFAQSLREVAGAQLDRIGGDAAATGNGPTARIAGGAPTMHSPATVSLARSQPGHVGGAGASDQVVSTRAQYVTPEQGTLDGNTVDLNRERAQFAGNAVRYEATLRFINSRVRTMLTAIRGE